MKETKPLFILITLPLLCITASLAQSSYPPQAPGAGRRPHQQQPCWQQAGIPRSTVQQYREITANAHHEIESVCSDSAIPAAEKRQKIQQIRQQTRSQVESLVSAQQLQAFDSCRASRSHGHAAHGENPCVGEPSGMPLAEPEPEKEPSSAPQ